MTVRKKLPMRLNYWMYCFSPTWWQGNSKTLNYFLYKQKRKAVFIQKDEIHVIRWERHNTWHQESRAEVAVSDLCEIVLRFVVGKCKVWTGSQSGLVCLPFISLEGVFSSGLFYFSLTWSPDFMNWSFDILNSLTFSFHLNYFQWLQDFLVRVYILYQI